LEEICEADSGWVDAPVPQDALVPAKEVFTAPNGVCGNSMETSGCAELSAGFLPGSCCHC